jgi:hypothetical protein
LHWCIGRKLVGVGSGLLPSRGSTTCQIFRTFVRWVAVTSCYPVSHLPIWRTLNSVLWMGVREAKAVVLFTGVPKGHIDTHAG